uniref:NADH-ubiquinone oxidoreductase chain 6 n=1 Tax=Cephaloscyllium umbratile TaxID=232419 RepID=A0A0Y0DZE5_9CHON|nr:NADH dehydrogenase subunit 6 [Cephaloscyllium umbratile]AMB27104.1 NADH dehydrogenase subunit 6 [Cephaloscyllium umbratile]APL97777.1 NADH dehydrogenase subunit 6 [Cephaloscyllium umbratile]
MVYFVSMMMVGLILGLMGVASNPSPYYAALGLVMAAGVGCGLLVSCGGSFMSLVLFLIYLGGMLVVFAYTAALAAEPYPEAWGDWSVLMYVSIYLMGLAIIGKYLLVEEWGVGWVGIEELSGLEMVRGDFGGVALLYSYGGWMLILSGWVLLVTLFVVLEVTRGLSWGTLRVI